MMDCKPGERFNDFKKMIYYYHIQRGLIDVREVYHDVMFPENINVVRIQDEVFKVLNQRNILDDDRKLYASVIVMDDEVSEAFDIFEIITDLTDVLPEEHVPTTDWTKATYVMDANKDPEFK